MAVAYHPQHRLFTVLRGLAGLGWVWLISTGLAYASALSWGNSAPWFLMHVWGLRASPSHGDGRSTRGSKTARLRLVCRCPIGQRRETQGLSPGMGISLCPQNRKDCRVTWQRAWVKGGVKNWAINVIYHRCNELFTAGMNIYGF